MKKIIPMLLFATIGLSSWAQQVRYVRAGGSGSGTNWVDASGDLQAMINASSNGDEVWVAAGTYQPDSGTWFSMKEGVKIYGGFPNTNDNATMTDRDWKLYSSILKGNGHSVIRNVFTASNKMTSASVLDGFTIKDGLYYGAGSGYSGGGIYNIYASPTLQNLIITENRAYAGGGIMCLYSSPIIQNTLVYGNSGAIGRGIMSDGGGANKSEPLIINSTIANNTGNEFLIRSAKAIFKNSIIYGVGGYTLGFTGSSTYDAYNSFIKDITTTDANNNINGAIDPLFRDYASNDFRLISGSPLIDKGNNSHYIGNLATDKDIYFKDRLYNTIIDIGAYENQGQNCSDDAVWNGSSWSITPSIETNLIIEGNLTVNSNLDGCSLTILSGNVVVVTNKTLKIANKVEVLGGSLTLNNGASLLQINDVANEGSITVKKTTKPVDSSNFFYWSSPVAGWKLNQIVPNTLSTPYYSWNPPAQTWTQHIGGNKIMDAAHGYIVRAPLSATAVTRQATFTGVPHNGNYTMPILGDSLANFLGNPYPSAINIKAFLDDPDNASLQKIVYLWTNGYTIDKGKYVYNASGFATYNAVGNVGESPTAQKPTAMIASAQGFFIYGASNGTVTFKNEHRVTGNNSNSFNRLTNPELDRYWINLETADQTLYSQTLIAYLEEATNKKDVNLDAPLLESMSSMETYSLINKNRMIIQARASFENSDVVNLGYNVAKAGKYTIKTPYYEGVFNQDQDIYLTDKWSGNTINLKKEAYTFMTEAGRFDERFELSYRRSTQESRENINWIAYGYQGDLQIEASAKFSSLQVYDLVGRLLYENHFEPTTLFTIPGTNKNQVLILKITTPDGIESTKKVKL